MPVYILINMCYVKISIDMYKTWIYVNKFVTNIINILEVVIYRWVSWC